MEAIDLNKIKNRFGILDEKQNMIRPRKLREFMGGTLGVDELAKSLGKSRAAMYRESIKLPTKFIEQHLIPIVWAADLAYELFEGNEEKARSWMLTPNSYFFGKSPFNYCLMGNGEAVVSFLTERSGRD